jgi:hypothetical protein
MSSCGRCRHLRTRIDKFGAFTLIRAFAKNAAAVLYGFERPEQLDRLLGIRGTPISIEDDHEPRQAVK